MQRKSSGSCRLCGKPRSYQAKAFCSAKCRALAKVWPSAEERFWPRVVCDLRTGCWLWMGSRLHSGYGNFSWNKRVGRSHRFSWELHFGRIPKGIDVLHKCDNPPCCRPDHLFLGTDRDNARDMIAKGRGWMQQHPERIQRGSNASNAKLTSAEVEKMRELRRDGWLYSALATHFGVTRRTAARAVLGKSFATEAGTTVPPSRFVPSGAEHGMAKLSQTQVEEMRRLHKETGIGQYRLARMFGISSSQTWRIIHEKSWH